MRLNFSKVFSLQAGPLVDIDLRADPSIRSQSGLGSGFGLGAELPISKKWVIQLNPYINLHSIRISKEDGYYPNPLLDRGIRIGIRTR